MNTTNKPLKLVTVICFTVFIVACSNNDNAARQAAEGAGGAVDNLIDGLKQMPAAIGEASRKVEQDIKDQ